MKLAKSGWTFSQTPIWACCDPDLSDKAFRLFAYLAWRQGTDAACWPSRCRIASDLDCSQETVRRSLRELEDLGYLLTERRPGRSNRYTLVADPNHRSSEYTPHKNEGGLHTKTRGTPHKNEGGPHTETRGTPHKNEPHDDNHGRQSNDGEEDDDTVSSLWRSVLENLRRQMTRQTFNLWLAHTTACLQANTLCVQLANPRAEDWVRHRLHRTIRRTARQVLNQPDLAITYHTREQA